MTIAERRKGFAVERQIPGEDAKVPGDFRILQQMAPLEAVRAGRVLADERDPGSVRFVVDAVFDAIDRQVDVAPDRLIVFCHSVDLSALRVLAHDLEHATERPVVGKKSLRITGPIEFLSHDPREHVVEERLWHGLQEFPPTGN